MGASTANWDNVRQPMTTEQTMKELDQSVKKNGFGAIVVHPQSYCTLDTSSVNQTAINDLQRLIHEVKQNYNVTFLSCVQTELLARSAVKLNKICEIFF